MRFYDNLQAFRKQTGEYVGVSDVRFVDRYSCIVLFLMDRGFCIAGVSDSSSRLIRI